MMRELARTLTEKAISKQHIEMTWLAFSVNTIAAIIIYLHFLKGNWIYLSLGISAM